MKITFIGSSHGVPEPNRKCACTMITIQDRIYFVDMGCPGIDALTCRGLHVNDVKGIFITHMHGDHTNGLISYLDLISWYYKEANPTVILPNIQSVSAIETWIYATGSKPRALNYQETKAGVIYNDGVLKVTAIPTQHCEKSYALLLEAQGKRVLFTGDLCHKGPQVDFPDLSDAPADLVICEAAHFPATAYEAVFPKYDIRRVIVHHYQPKYIPSILELAETPGMPPVSMAHDDLEVVL